MAQRKRKTSHGTAVHKPRMYANGTPGPTALCDLWIGEGILSTVTDADVTCRKCLAALARMAAARAAAPVACGVDECDCHQADGPATS